MDTEKALKDIVAQMQKSLECSICLELLNCPVSTKCDHQFCRNCKHCRSLFFCLFKFLQNKRSVPCPLCKKPIIKRGLQERSDLTGVIENVKRLITAFETDTGEKFQELTSPRKLKEIFKDDNTYKNCENTLTAKNISSLELKTADCPEQERSSRSKTKCRVSNRTSTSINHHADDEATNSKTAEKKSKKENKSLVNNEEQNVGNLLQYLENGPCGEKKKRTGRNKTKNATEKLKVLNQNYIHTHKNKSEKFVEIDSEEQKLNEVSEKENPGRSSKEDNLLAETGEQFTVGLNHLSEIANESKVETSAAKRNTPKNKTRATRSSTRSRGKHQELSAEEPEQDHRTTESKQEPKATGPQEEHRTSKSKQDHRATKPIQEHIATKPIQEHNITKPNQEHKTTETDKVSSNEEEAGQCSASSSVSSVSSTQQLLKPKPVVSRTYSRGMQNKFQAEGCVRNWVETLPKPDVAKETKPLTTKEKINVKKRANINLLNSKTFNTNVVSKTIDNFNSNLKECISGKDLVEPPITPRLRRSLFKNRPEDKVPSENIAGHDPFEFTSSQTPVKAEVKLSKKRKRSKDEKSSKIAEKRAPLNFLPALDLKSEASKQKVCEIAASDLKSVITKQTALQIETKEADSAQGASIVNAIDTLVSEGHQPEALSNFVEENRENMLDCLVDTVQNTNVQSEMVIEDTNTDSCIINANNFNQPTEALKTRGDHTNNGRPSPKSRVAKKKGPQVKKKNNIIMKDFPAISQNSHSEMTKLIDKISQAEDHEFLFCTQEVHKKMEESVSGDQIVLANTSPASKDIILQTQSTDIIADSMAVPVKVQESDTDIVKDTFATQALEEDALLIKIQSDSSSGIVMNTEISSELAINVCQKQDIAKGTYLKTAYKDTISCVNEPTNMQTSVHQTPMQKKSCASDDKYLLDPKTPQANHLSVSQPLFESLKTPKGESVLMSSNTPQSENLLKKSRMPEVETLLENSNTPQAKQFSIAPKTPQNNSLSGNLWTPQCKQLSETPKSPITTPNRSFTSKYCLPNLKEMIQVSPGPKGFIPVNSSTTSGTNGSGKSVVPGTNQDSVSVYLDIFSNRSNERSDKTIGALKHVDELNGSHDTTRSVHLNKRKQFLVSEISDMPEDTIHGDKTILVPDTVIDGVPTEMDFKSQDKIVIHETLDVDQMSTCRSTSSESDQEEPDHNAVTNEKSNHSNKEKITDKSCLQTVMKTQHASLESTISPEILSTTQAEKLTNHMAKDFSCSPNVDNGTENLQTDNGEETPSTMSQSILKVNLDQVMKGTETIKVLSTKSETKCNDNNINVIDGSGDCITETEIDFPPSRPRLLPNIGNNSRKKHKLDDDSLCQTVPKKAHLAKKLAFSGVSVNSAPGRFDFADSEDEDSFLLVRRSKHRCLSLNDTPLKPIVFNSRREETVHELDDLVGETEAINVLVNCTESEKTIDASPETDRGTSSLITDKELDSPTTNTCAAQLKTSVDIVESVYNSSAEMCTSSDAKISNKCPLTSSAQKSSSTDSCQQETEIIPESSTTNSYKLSTDKATVKKTKRGFASKKMIDKPNSSNKLPSKSPNKDSPVLIENINDLELSVQESNEKQEDRLEKDLIPDNTVKNVSKKTEAISSKLSISVKDKSLSEDKNQIRIDINTLSPEKSFQRQLEQELFEDGVEKVERMGKTFSSEEANDTSPKHKGSVVATISEEDVEMSFDLGLDCDDQETVPEQAGCLNNEIYSQGNEPIPETAQNTNHEDEDLENGNSLSGSLPLTSSPLHGNTNSEKQDNLNQSAISADDNFDDVKNTDDEKDDDDDDCVRIKKRGKKQMIVSDSDQSDNEDQTMATSSSFMSSQSETLTTQQQLALEGDLEKLHQEIAKCEAELRKEQYSACLSPGQQPKTPQANDSGSNYVKDNSKNCELENSNLISAVPTDNTHYLSPVVIEDSPVCVSDDEKSDENSNDLFLSPEPPVLTPNKDLPGISSGSKPTRLSQVKDHFLKQFQSPGGSFRSKKCLEFMKADVIRDSGHSNKGPSAINKNIPNTESHISSSDRIGEKATSPVLSSQKKNFSFETKRLEGKKNELCKKKFVLTASGLNRDDNILLIKFCEKFGAVLHPKFTKEVSHVIMKLAPGYDLVCDRTLKFFQGLAHKCWVLSFAWIAKSLTAGDVLFEADFEIEGDTSCGETLYGAKHARLSKKHLFTNFSFACIGNSEEMSKENLCEILQASGAVIVDDPIALASQPTKYKLIIRCSDGDNMPTPVELDMFNGLYKHMKLLTIMREWVLDSLSSYGLIPLLDYVLNTADQVQVPF